MMLIMTILSCVALVLMESDICLCFKKLTFREIPPEKDVDDLDLDEDVLGEEERVN